MNNFQKASVKERQKAEALLISKGVTEYGFTDDEGYDQHDGWYTTKTGKIICFEVKNRNVSSTKYRTTVIEKKKYEYMTNEQKVGEPYLFVFFTDDKVLVENLTSRPYKQTQFMAPKTTADYSNKILKLQIEIPIDNTNILTFISTNK
jgi:hypothetical protein